MAERIVSDGKETLLETLSKAGIEWPYQCRSGFCGRCKGFVSKGRLRELREPDIIMIPGAILTCSTTGLEEGEEIEISRRPQ